MQLADDCMLSLEDETSLESSLKVVENFSKVAGMKLNMSKMECILTGPNEYSFKKNK
jgi:hypothetical protein